MTQIIKISYSVCCIRPLFFLFLVIFLDLYSHPHWLAHLEQQASLKMLGGSQSPGASLLDAVVEPLCHFEKTRHDDQTLLVRGVSAEEADGE